MIRRVCRFVCMFAVCAAALLSAPRTAHAQIVELDVPVTCGQAFIDSSQSNPQARYALTSQFNLRTYSWDSGTSVTSDNSSTLHTTYYFQTQIGLGAYAPFPDGSDHGMNSDGSWDMSTHPAVALFYELYNFGDANTNLLFVTSRTMAVLHNPNITATNATSTTRTVASTPVRRFFYYLPHGADRTDRNAWVYITRNADGYFHLSGAIDCFAIVLVMDETLQSSSLTFSQWDPQTVQFGVQQVPSCYVSIPDTSLSALATGQDIDDAATTISSSVSSQTVTLGQTLVHSTENQTDSLMDTSGSGDILSDQVTSVGDSLEVGIFGQLDGLRQDFISSLTTTGWSSKIHFPGINVMGYQLAREQDVYIFSGALSDLQPIVRTVCTFVFITAWVNGMYWIFQHQILGMDSKGGGSE